MTRLIVLDVETTGVARDADEVIELAVQFGLVGAAAGCAPAQRVWRFRPSKSVGSSAQVHGITDEMLAREPTFAACAPTIAQVLAGGDVIVGYNVQFDLDMLAAAFARARVECPPFERAVIVDALRLWHQREPRTLAAAHERFVGGALVDAHSAGADVAATGVVLLGMLKAFGLEGLPWAELAAIADPDRLTWLGPSSHIRWIDGVPTITFGKHKGRSALDPEVRSYLRWMQGADFPAHVKEIAAAAQTPITFLEWARRRYPPPAPAVVAP